MSSLYSYSQVAALKYCAVYLQVGLLYTIHVFAKLIIREERGREGGEGIEVIGRREDGREGGTEGGEMEGITS